ncbi:MAG: hypothetical protein FWH14_00145 [Oscillospiraceae bacterium]|nr:hypothetical protein [Oscillospiraceae bacterium]
MYTVNRDVDLTRKMARSIEQNIADRAKSPADKSRSQSALGESYQRLFAQYTVLSQNAVTNIVPFGVSGRFFKRVINKLIKHYTHQQVEYNRAVSDMTSEILAHTALMMSEIDRINMENQNT